MLAATQILAALPGSLSSAVVFRLEPLRTLADDQLLRHMFSLPPSADPIEDSHVVLTPAGPLLAAPNHGRIRLASDQAGVHPLEPRVDSLLARFGEQLALLPRDEPDCLGVGQIAGSPAVGLHVLINGLVADAVATLAGPPPRRPLDLLRAVGVEYLGGDEVPGAYLARFRNRLDQHLMAGALAGFERTDHCNLFFMAHGILGPDLEQGLLHAAGSRIARTRGRVLASVRALALESVAGGMAMTCIPPPPAPPVPYGDLVPLGFLLSALPEDDDAAAAVRTRLARDARDGLWSFHAGGLQTATDTVLAGQAMDDARTDAALERFRDDDGGYVPQLSSIDGAPGTMRREESTAHWCAPDMATTCLVLARRRRAGLPTGRAMRWVAGRFDTRHGLFFATPFLTDWALARALAEGPAGPLESLLATRLRGDILAAQNEDGSFGRYDQALSTALAILALADLGERGRPVLLAQLRLLDWVGADASLPPAVPFFSSLRRPAPSGTGRPSPQRVVAGNQVHELTYYRDEWGQVSTALAARALAVRASGDQSDPSAAPVRAACHPRYRCPDIDDYVGAFVLAQVAGADPHAMTGAVRP